MKLIRKSRLLASAASAAVVVGVMTMAAVGGTAATAGAATPPASPCTFTYNGTAYPSNSVIPGVTANSNITVGCASGTTPDNASVVIAEASSLAGLLPSSESGDASDEGDLGDLKFVTASATGGIANTVFTTPNPFSATDPNAKCPTTTAETNDGVIQCAVAVATLSGTNYGDAQLQYITQTQPAAPSLALSPTTASAGDQVTLSDGGSGVWWGDPYAATTLNSSEITLSQGSTTVDAGDTNASISAASYNIPAHQTTGTLTNEVLSGTFVVPCGITGAATVKLTEPNAVGATGTPTASAALTISANGTTPAVTSISPTYGPLIGGNTVTISGCNFNGVTGANGVDFGNTPATSYTVAPDGDSITAVAPAGNGTVNIVVHKGSAQSTTSSATEYTYESLGYTEVGSDGGTFSFGGSSNFGSLPGLNVKPAAPVVGIANLPSNLGYWLVGSDGGVYSFGKAQFYGSLPSLGLKATSPIVGITTTSDGLGYWLVSANGSVYAFGDAIYYGSLPGLHVTPSKPIVGITATSAGYYLAGADGGVYAFGNAKFQGSIESVNATITSPVVGIAGTSDAGGYWLATSNGAVYSFGDATYLGSLPGLSVTPKKPIVGIVSPDSGGYTLIGGDGGAFCFGNATFFGSMAGKTLAAPIVGATA